MTDTTLNSTQGEIQDQAGGAKPSSFAPGEETPETPSESPLKALLDEDDADQGQPDTTAELDALRAENDALVLQVARLTVAAETGVPADLLRGQDEDELREHAEALVAYAGARATPDFGAGNRGESVRPENTDPLRTALGR